MARAEELERLIQFRENFLNDDKCWRAAYKLREKYQLKVKMLRDYLGNYAYFNSPNKYAADMADKMDKLDEELHFSDNLKDIKKIKSLESKVVKLIKESSRLVDDEEYLNIFGVERK